MPGTDKHGIHRPSREQIEQAASQLNLSLNEKEVEDYLELVHEAIAGLEPIVEAQDPTLPPQKFEFTDRSPGYRPDQEENPNNVWVTKCKVKGSDSGPLAGKEIGLKDNISLAGYELTGGSYVMEGFVPTIDATIVTRMLKAGATITGKLNMDGFAHTGSGDVSDFGTVRNPHDSEHIAGGSSSGSGAAVSLGEVDVAIGSDQGGSIRIPASWCGVVGLKPTSGLVPYTGAVPEELSIDTLGPLARNVKDVATTLEVIAGEDVQDGLRLDPRQHYGVEGEEYTDALDKDVKDLTLGVVEEGFGWENSDPAVDEAVRDAISIFEDLGVETKTVSNPMHRMGPALLGAIMTNGFVDMLKSGGVPSGLRGWHWEELVNVSSKFMRGYADELPFAVKRTLLTGTIVKQEHSNRFYAKAQNLALEAQRQYNKIFESCDAVICPTTTILPLERSETEMERKEHLERAFSMIGNMPIFSVTHHPSMSMPCAKVDGLPVGMMLSADHFNESMLIRLCNAFEKKVDWEDR